MKRRNAYQKIREGMRENERDVLRHIKLYGRIEGFWPMGKSWRNAITRLEEKGKVRFSPAESGYVLVGKRKRSRT